MPDSSSLTYRDAGVDIESGERLVESIREIAARTRRPGCLDTLGGFGALFEIPAGYRQPLLVSGTDGVGTKLKLAGAADRHEVAGIDLVAMCVNDILCHGAEPLYFLDYFAAGRLDRPTAVRVLHGIGQGCEQAGAALIGGETAEMPGMYASGDYDLAGFCVGVVEKTRLIDGRAVTPGDRLIGLAASGPHANGYSLIRSILKRRNAELTERFGAGTLADALLAPTRIYVKAVLATIAGGGVHAIAHITGGGLPGNLPRALPEACAAQVDAGAWSRPAIFDWIQQGGNVSDAEMLKTFNCGIGMILVIGPDQASRALAVLRQHGEQAMLIGRIVRRGDRGPVHFG